ncbi:hypothetical protein Pfo_000964 [Paulownia fortunei]|nr:hypothetical protein Pfo_000964 [Paulownia fortunei]
MRYSIYDDKSLNLGCQRQCPRRMRLNFCNCFTQHLPDMSSSEGNEKCKDGNKKSKGQSSINFLACTKFKSKQNNNKSPRPITNIAFCSFINEDLSEEEFPSNKDVKGKGKEPKEVAKSESKNAAK